MPGLGQKPESRGDETSAFRNLHQRWNGIESPEQCYTIWRRLPVNAGVGALGLLSPGAKPAPAPAKKSKPQATKARLKVDD